MKPRSDRALFISRKPDRNTGGYKVIARNLEMVRHIYGFDQVDVVEVPIPSLPNRLFNLICAQGYGVTMSINARIKRLLETHTYAMCFIDSSAFGSIAEMISKRNIPTIVFCHNVEAKYFIDKYHLSRNPLDYIMIKYASVQEKKSFGNCSYIITLNERDNNGIRELYGREADLILPTSFDSHITDEKGTKAGAKPYCLFVGSNFFANQEGISWFINNVVPSLNMDLWIVGNICEYVKSEYKESLPNNIHLFGIVEDLDPYYREALCVISPIFSGSGLKTKSIEALSYAKTLIATDEGWEGIEVNPEDIDCFRCNNTEEFLTALSSITITSNLNNKVREFFISNYSDDVITERFKNFLQDNSLI